MNQITLKIVTRQAEAMGVEVFEVGLYKPAVEGGPNEPEMLPRTWDKATLLKSVGWLKHQNSQGRNIYIRPKGEHHLSLVDDLTGTAIQRMKSEGFQPAVVVETSPGNFQAWLNHGRVLSQSGIDGSRASFGREVRRGPRRRRLAALRPALRVHESKAEI